MMNGHGSLGKGKDAVLLEYLLSPNAYTLPTPPFCAAVHGTDTGTISNRPKHIKRE